MKYVKELKTEDQAIDISTSGGKRPIAEDTAADDVFKPIVVDPLGNR
jgi:hypothetical protein